MNDEHLEAILIECLEAGASIEELLARFPAEAAQLVPELRIAARLTAWGEETQRETPSASGQARAAFLAQAASMAPATQPLPHLPGFLRSRLVMSLVALVVVLVSIGGGVFGASAASLPGDPLYGVKRSFENIQLSLVHDPVQRANLEESFLNRRAEEVKAVQASKRVTSVEFVGNVEAMEQDRWTVDGFTIQVTFTTSIEGSPQVGSIVQVTGHTLPDGQIIADRIEVEGDGNTATPHPPTATPKPASSSTSRPGATATPTPRLPQKAEPTQKPEEAETPEPGGTVAPTRGADPSRTPEPPRPTEPGHTPEPTRGPEPTHAPEPTHSPEPSRTPEPTHAPEPTRTREPSRTPEPSRTREPSRTPEPSRTQEPSRSPEPTRTREPTRMPEPSRMPEATKTTETSKTPEPTRTAKP